ncbi:hypothetical protein MHEL_06260 [Mycolicibacterium helvum]|uniref:Uncharacterized protein n=1 Tax=Mycolicibacterium helvum TaxID=1534349 RepID=A0A7I7T0D6_9MYCO|nr:hypothetical protein MHEL_06260 [Mycolicibacterium helvum]
MEGGNLRPEFVGEVGEASHTDFVEPDDEGRGRKSRIARHGLSLSTTGSRRECDHTTHKSVLSAYRRPTVAQIMLALPIDVRS